MLNLSRVYSYFHGGGGQRTAYTLETDSDLDNRQSYHQLKGEKFNESRTPIIDGDEFLKRVNYDIEEDPFRISENYESKLNVELNFTHCLTTKTIKKYTNKPILKIKTPPIESWCRGWIVTTIENTNEKTAESVQSAFNRLLFEIQYYQKNKIDWDCDTLIDYKSDNPIAVNINKQFEDTFNNPKYKTKIDNWYEAVAQFKKNNDMTWIQTTY